MKNNQWAVDYGNEQLTKIGSSSHKILNAHMGSSNNRIPSSRNNNQNIRDWRGNKKIAIKYYHVLSHPNEVENVNDCHFSDNLALI